MRRAPQGKPGIVRDEDGTLLGANLGYDYCAEHESGIGDIRFGFGLMPKGEHPETWGIARRTVTQVPAALKLVDQGDAGLAILYNPHESSEKYILEDLLKAPSKRVEVMKKNGKPFKNPKFEWVPGEFGSAWDSSGFAFRSTDREAVQEIWDALQAKDATVMLGGPDGWNPFGGAGIVIGIKSRFPPEVLDAQYEYDKEQYEVNKYMADSGIEELLKDSGKRWFALRPSRMAKGLTTKNGRKAEPGDICFWLNPMEQHKYNSGWWTLADLQAWAQNKGPVMKEAR
jgi:hypothetical protein